MPRLYTMMRIIQALRVFGIKAGQTLRLTSFLIMEAEKRYLLADLDYGRRPNIFKTGRHKRFGNFSLRYIEDPETKTPILYTVKESNKSEFPHSYLRFVGDDIKETIKIINVSCADWDSIYKLHWIMFIYNLLLYLCRKPLIWLMPLHMIKTLIS